MCRFLVYKGSDEILLSKLILDPAHSILTQSFDARLRLDHGRNNADGFGIAYYNSPEKRPQAATPCIFTSTTPAWNCANLHRLANHTTSHLIFAHVRATTEGSLSDDNCHPFSHATLTFMHNGGIGGWKHIKRRLGMSIGEKWYLGVQGGTDSEWAFALFLDTLENMGYNPSETHENGFGPQVLRKAMLKTIQKINDFIDAIPEAIRKAHRVDTRSLLNFAVTDGHSVVCTRYVSSTTDEAASLYYSSGTTWHEKDEKNFQMDRRDKGADIVLVASEPLTFERDNWVTVPTNSTLTIHKQTVMVHPIVDKYYSHNPYHMRSSRFVAEKGLVSNEKPSTTPGATGSPRGHTPAPTPLATPGIEQQEDTRRPTLSSRQSEMSRSMTVEPLPIYSALLNQHPPSQAKITNYDSSPRDPRHSSPPPIFSVSSRDPSKPQEQTNTKKKRTIVPRTDDTEEQNGGQSDSEDRQSSYGDPAKLARYFPELNLT